MNKLHGGWWLLVLSIHIKCKKKSQRQQPMYHVPKDDKRCTTVKSNTETTDLCCWASTLPTVACIKLKKLCKLTFSLTNKSVSSLGCTYLPKASLWVWDVKLHVLLHVLFIQLQMIKNVWYTLARWNYSLRVRNQSPYPSYTIQYSVKSVKSHWTGEDKHRLQIWAKTRVKVR